MGRATTRTLAWAALAGQAIFIASWIVGGALEPGYSHLREGVSALGAKDAAHPWIANAGIVVLGLSIVALGLAVARVLPRRPARKVAGLLFAGAGVAIALGGVFRMDCSLAVQSCEDAWRAGRLSWQTDGHLWTGLVGQTLFVLTPYALARALWPGPAALAALSSGSFGVAFGVASFFAEGHDPTAGLVQRVGLAVLHLWVLIVAVGVLYATRRPARPGRLVPVRPREFFAQAWSGEGELMLRPFFIGRFFAQRFSARREATWLSETAFRFDDEASFGAGRSQRRRLYCEFVTEDHVRVTAGDMPDGADAWFEEDGYRVTPFRMAFPIGPVPVYIRVHDVSYVEPDGTFANIFEARDLVFGIPIARLTFRVRPVDSEATGSSAAGRSSGSPAVPSGS
jgi:Protein of unknown function (DUF998)